MSGATRLQEVRLAVALSHCLPECSVELTDASGGTLLVGFGEGAAVTPCAACVAVTTARQTCAELLGPLLGLAHGCPRARVLADALAESHVGLGVFRYLRDDVWGYVFVTLLGAEAVGLAIKRASSKGVFAAELAVRETVELGRWSLGHEPGLDVTVCSNAYPLERGDLVAPAEELALDVAVRCLVDELTDETAP